MNLDDARARLIAAGLEPDRVHRLLDADAHARLEGFFELRAKWTRTHNLSGPRALSAPWGADLIDGAAVAALCPSDACLVDVGAGSGIPGLIVACLEPSRPVHLVEPIAKKTAFLRSAAARLGLGAVRVHRARWPITVPAGNIVSRAVVDPAVWPRLAAEGGDRVRAIVRMLAARRPPMDVSGFELANRIDYTMPDGAARTIERWARQT